jgi:hypothetical protein
MRNGTILMTLDIPVGVYVSVSYGGQQRPDTGQDGRPEFHGDVEIRTRLRSGVEPANRRSQRS